MADFYTWVENNWSSAIGAVGIIGSLLFTASTFREDSRNRLISNLLAIDERHRLMWGEARQRKNLARVFLREVDLANNAMSIAEIEFVDSAILHFETGWRIERILNRGEMKLLARDAGEFFSLPLPRAVWEKTRGFRNQRFVRFVEGAISRKN